MTLVSRPLAGPGTPGTALNVLQTAGWNLTSDEKANAYAFPPDRRLVVAFLPEANDFAPDGPLWVIRAYGDMHNVEWQAGFTENTPAELIAAFLTDLIKPEPLDTEREDDEAAPPATDAA
jgi:hypothetical protein